MVAHVMVRIHPGDIPEQGLKVRYRYGECFGKEIEWSDVSEGVLVAQERTNAQNEPGINLQDLDDHGYAGFETRTGTYWRYKQDEDPDVYREYCMQIIEIDEPFKPSSSWSAWEMLGSQCERKRLYAALKNLVTGTELIYRIQDKGFGYQYKDIANGRRTQKMIKHDYLYNRLLQTTYKKLDHHHVRITASESSEEPAVLSFELRFESERLLLRYQINEVDFSLGVFAIEEDELELVKMIELPHSSLVDDGHELLG